MAAFVHGHVDAGMGGDEARDGFGKPARAAQRHGAHRDPPAGLALQRRDFGQPGAQLGHGQAKAAGAALSRRGQHQRPPAPLDQPLPQRDRKVGHGAVEAEPAEIPVASAAAE